MLTEDKFAVELYDNLQVGDFFFHPLSGGGNTPALKVMRSDNVVAVVDLDAEQVNGTRKPTLMEEDSFAGVSVIKVPSAVIRMQDGLQNCVNGAGGTANQPDGALILRDDGVFIRVKHKIQSLIFSLQSGIQGSSKDSARCAWSEKWEIVIRDTDKIHVLFSR